MSSVQKDDTFLRLVRDSLYSQCPSRLEKKYTVPSYITSSTLSLYHSNIVQDLLFGRKTLTLSCGTKIDIPNVIRTLFPSRPIEQYNQYFSEEIKLNSQPVLCLEYYLKHA